MPQESEVPPVGERRRELPMPPVVYVPCTPGDDGISHLAYRNLDDGRVALLEAYSWGVCEYESEDGGDGFWEGF